MKAAAFHDCMRQALGPAFTNAGFSASGRSGRWKKALAGERTIDVVLRLDKWGWSEPWGSQFTVDVRLDDPAATSRPGAVLPDANDAHVLEFLDVDAVRTFCRLRNAVVDKGLACASTDPVAAMAMAVEREVRALDKRDSPMPNMATWFPWIDADDVAAWGAFLAPVVTGLESALPALVAADARERRVALRNVHLQSDPRTEEEKAADRARRKAANAASNKALGAFGAALESTRE
jgi:hypothetical protein